MAVQPQQQQGLFALPNQQPQASPLADVLTKLAAAIPGFEHRPEQLALAERILHAIESRTHLLAEAPTGTGKSFAAALPLAKIAQEDCLEFTSEGTYTGRRIVIATANNNLLEQYAQKDLPLLRRIFPTLRWARAKGRNNYACNAKAFEVFNQQLLLDDPEQKSLNLLRAWYDQNESGDKETVRGEFSDQAWQRIAADDTCNGRNCDFYDQCHYYRARWEAHNAVVTVTNYDVLMLHLLIPRAMLLPDFDILILDEAHQLEDKAIGQMEVSFTEQSLINLITLAHRRYEVSDSELHSIRQATYNLFNQYRMALGSQEKVSIIADEALRAATIEFESTMDQLRAYIIRYKTSPGSRNHKRQQNDADRAEGFADAARTAIQHDPRSVTWVENAKNTLRVATCPFRVASQLHSLLFGRDDLTIICMSATLATAPRTENKKQPDGTLLPVAISPFDFFAGRVGCLRSTEFVCPSPFSYQRQAAIYLPEAPPDAKDPKGKEWEAWAQNQMVELLKLSQGSAFVLSTSVRGSKMYAEYLQKLCPGLQIKAQGAMTNSKMIDWFKLTPNAVLVGTSSFWEGVSVEGEALRLVIVDKIPFTPHTDPIQQAREAWYKADPQRKSRAFMDLQVAPAIIRLKQGFGRLIRTKSDRGVVALLDPRLKKPYGKAILGALPKAPIISHLGDARLPQLLAPLQNDVNPEHIEVVNF